MGHCLFTSFAMGAKEYTDLLNAATGTNWTIEQVLEIATVSTTSRECSTRLPV